MQGVRISIDDQELLHRVTDLLEGLICGPEDLPALVLSNKPTEEPIQGAANFLLITEGSLPPDPSGWDEIIPIPWLSILRERVNRHLSRIRSAEFDEGEAGAFHESAQYRAVLESLDQAVMVTDRIGRVLFLNRSMLNMTGHPSDALRGDGFPERLFVSEGVRQRPPSPDERRRATLERIRTAQGELKTVAVASSIIPGTTHLLSVFTDVTRDHETAELLRSQWNQLQLMLHHLPILLWEMDGAGKLIYLEGSLLERMGILPHRYLGRRAKRLGARDPSWAALRSVVYGGASETVIKTVRGLTMRLHISPVEDEGGRVKGMMGLCTDISDLLLALSALRRQKAFFASLFDQLPVGVYVLDPLKDFACTLVNHRASELLGIHADQPGANVYPLQEDRERLNDLLAEGPGVIVLERIVERDTQKQYLKILMVPVKTEDEAPVMLGIVEDVSDQRVYEEQISRAREEAEEANDHKTQFVAHMSHEIRTPLNSIIGFTEILLNRLGPLSAHGEYLRGIQSSSQSLLLLLNDILDFSRLEAGGADTRNQTVEISALLRDVESMFASRAAEKGLGFSVHLDPGLPPYLLLDDVHFRQIAVNLVGNALKYTPSGRIDLYLAGQQVPGKEAVDLTLSIRDTGIGIPPVQIERIFEPFQQGDHSLREGGSGLGLAISSRLARLMGGSIEVQSAPAAGSVFRLHLPGVPVSHVPAIGRPALDRLSHIRFNGARVLIVEDDPGNRRVLVEFLAGMDLVIEEAANGAEALDCLARARPDLILMDLQMPVLDGYEAAVRIRKQPGNADIPILALTGATSTEELNRIEGIMNGCLRKPFTRNDLLVSVSNFLPFSEEETKTEEAVSPVDLKEELILNGVVDAETLLLRVREIRSSLNLNDIRDLATDLIGYAGRGDGLSLHRFAERLANSADTISVARIILLLDHLIDCLNRRTPSASKEGRYL